MAKLYVVATPIGNLKDISLRAIEILKHVDIIICEDTRTSKILMDHYEITTPLQSYHKFNEKTRSEEICNLMIEKDLEVALISDAGTPCICDPGFYIVEKAREYNIDVFTIPGPSAVISALSVSGFHFIDFSFLGFFPRENLEKKNFLDKIINMPFDTLVFYESPKRIVDTLKFLLDNAFQANVIVCNELTKKFEKYYNGSLQEVYEDLLESEVSDLGEYVVVMQKLLIEKKEEKQFSLECFIVQDLIENGGTTKDAIKRLSKKFNKNDLYKASLNLKELL